MSEQQQTVESVAAMWESLARERGAELTRLHTEKAAITEELAANRACNLFTWKERAMKAEAELTRLRAEKESAVAERDEARRALTAAEAEAEEDDDD